MFSTKIGKGWTNQGFSQVDSNTVKMDGRVSEKRDFEEMDGSAEADVKRSKNELKETNGGDNNGVKG